METAISSAMRKAGFQSGPSALYVAASEALRGATLEQALSRFVATIAADRELLDALAMQYLQIVQSDMRGKNSTEAEAQMRSDRQIRLGSVSAETQADGRPRKKVAATSPAGQLAVPSAPDQSRGGSDITFRHPSRPALSITIPVPAPKRGFAERRALKDRVGVSIFDTIKLRDGTPVGDLRWSQLDRFIANNSREASLLRLIRDYGRPADPNARIRDVVNLADLQRMVQRAAEIFDAQ